MSNLLKFNSKYNNMILFCVLSFFISRVDFLYIGVSFLACLFLKKRFFNSAIILAILGSFSIFNFIYTLKYIVCICMLFISSLFLKKSNTLHKSMFAGISILTSNLIFRANFTTTFLETLLIFFITIIFDKGVTYLLNSNKKDMSNEETISISLLIASAICGISGISVFSVYISHFLIYVLILFISYIYGGLLGGVCSILSCLLLYLTGYFSSNLLIILSVSSIICGFIRHMGKLLYSICFSISICIFSLIVDISLFTNSFIFSILGTITIFLAIPCKNVFNLGSISEESATYTEKLKSVTSTKLNTYSSSFEKLSQTFSNLSEKKQTLNQNDISNLIDEVVSKACTKCSLKNDCWEKNFYNSYQHIFNLLNNQEYIGNFNRDNIPLYFLRKCINTSQFIDILNKTVEIYKLNLMWKNKLIESRQLVSKQLNGVSDIMQELSEKLCEDIIFNDSLSSKLKTQLNINKIPTKNVIVIENSFGKTEVLLKVEPCYVPNKCSKIILPIANEVIGKKMCRDCYECIIKKEDNNSICSIRLIEEQKFRIKSATVSAHKYSSVQSGDSHSSSSLPDGKHLLAISDGMGSGFNAKTESSATIELLEDFLNAGFSNELALNMINSTLFLKSSKESFSTLDMCVINLYTGVAEFIKIGAVSSFIIRKNKVETLKSNSLPVGILNNLETELKTKKLYNNDIVVIVSDGVTDSKAFTSNNYEWLEIFLENLNTKNPNEIANAIFEETKKNYCGELKDDVTIIVSKIWNID